MVLTHLSFLSFCLSTHVLGAQTFNAMASELYSNTSRVELSGETLFCPFQGLAGFWTEAWQDELNF